MPKRGLGTQVAVFAIVVVCVVAAIGVLSLTQSGATSTSSSEGTSPATSTTSTVEATTCAPSPGKAGNATVTITETAQWPPCSCALVDSNSNGTLYVSTNAVVGDDVCIAASMSASPIVSFKVIGPTGGVFLPGGGCVNSAGTAVSCATSWNTAQLPYPGGGQVQPGDYELIATGDLQSLRANFTLSSSNISSQSTTSSQAKAVTECMETVTTTFVNVTTTQTATEEMACVASSSGLSVSGLSLCPTNCVYPAPYLTGQLNVNGTSPLSRIDVYVNGTFDGTPVQNPSTTSPGCTSSGNHTTCSTESVVTNTLTRFAYIYKGSIPSQFIPAVVGDRYVVTFVATFQDGSSALASVIVVAE